MDTYIKNDAVINLFEDDSLEEEIIQTTIDDTNLALPVLNLNESGYESELSVISSVTDNVDDDTNDLLLLCAADYIDESGYFCFGRFEDSENELKKSVECADSIKIINNQYNRVKSQKQLGEGANAKVYLAMKGSEYVALKVPNDNPDVESEARDSMKKEIEILKEFDDENIIKIYDYETKKNSIYYTMEYMGENASLRNFMDENHEKHPLTEKSIKSITRQLTRATSVMHDRGIVHCDIKSDNLLLRQKSKSGDDEIDFAVKLIDFGSAKRCLQNEYITEPTWGTEYTMAPELLQISGKYRYNNKIDIWSIGCVLIEMHTGLRKVYGRKKPVYPPNLTNEEIDFLDHCFEFDPESRYTTKDLLKHRFLQNN